MNILNTAIIGAGAIHSCHVNALRQIPNVALRALVDIDSVKGLKLAMNYQCRFYQDYREMLLDDSIDVVHICTPHFEHKNMILAALAAGKHVFCEKPVGMNSSELADIASAAAQAPGRLGVCYQNRLNPTSLRIRKEPGGRRTGKDVKYQSCADLVPLGGVLHGKPVARAAGNGRWKPANQPGDPYPRSDAVVRGWRHAAEGGSRQRGTG